MLGVPPTSSDKAELAARGPTHPYPILVILFLVWAFVCTLAFLKGGNGTKSPIGLVVSPLPPPPLLIRSAKPFNGIITISTFASCDTTTPFPGSAVKPYTGRPMG